MHKFLSISLINESKTQEADPGMKYLIENLTELNYTVRKVSAVEHDPKSISFELEHGLKQNDFVVLIDKCNLEVTLRSVCDVFNTELVLAQSIHEGKAKLRDTLVPKLTNILEYDNSIKLNPAIYLGRLFIIREHNLKLVYENILKLYLRKFNKERHFAKWFYFRDCDIELSDLSKKCNCVQLNHEKQEDLIVLEVKCSDLVQLVEYQKKIKTKYGAALLKEVYFSESIYDRNCFYHIRKAIECVEESIREYEPENIFLSFNGGKDCTVLLHLVLGVLREHYPNYGGRLVCMYIQSLNPFPEVNSFIDLISHYYNLEIVTITKNVKEGLETFLHDRPHMKACLMGTRRSDPYSEHLNICQMTDPTWPQVMRVSPLLDWNYCEIWDYLLYFQVPYCILYDQGYTSLGSVNNTIRNPALLYTVGGSAQVYLPAYKLLKGNKERDGRI